MGVFSSDLEKDGLIRVANVTYSHFCTLPNKVAVSRRTAAQIAVRLDVGGPGHWEVWNHRNPTEHAGFTIESHRASHRPCFQEGTEGTEQALYSSGLGC